MTADFEPAIAMFVDRSRVFINSNDHQAIVIHKTAGSSSAQNVAAWFATDPAMSSTHFVIGRDGTVVQCVLLVDGAAGNGILDPGHDPFWDQWSDNPNFHTISIEHVDPATDNSTPVTDAQKQASFALVSHLCQKYGIAADHIKPHSSLQPINRARCPGNYPFEELVAFIAREGAPMLQYTEHAHDFSTWYTAVDANHWKCKQTGQIVQFGIKAFYQQLSLDGQSLPLPGLPLTNEVYVTLPTGQIVLQVYERAGIVYDQNHLKDKPPGMGAAYLVKIQDQDFLRLIPGLQLPTALPEQVMKDIQAVSAAVATLTKDAGV